jgi:high-affinity nickel-transport protein
MFILNHIMLTTWIKDSSNDVIITKIDLTDAVHRASFNERLTLHQEIFMQRLLHILLDDSAGKTRSKIFAIYGLLLAMNLAAWLWAIVAFRHYPVLLGTAFLAYSFGLRHAVDADHIAAIDNVTRKLMQEGKRPVAVGFMFSLGHSTIVVIGSILIAATALSLQRHMDAARHIGGIIGTAVSTLFLFGIAVVNIVVIRSI